MKQGLKWKKKTRYNSHPRLQIHLDGLNLNKASKNYWLICCIATLQEKLFFCVMSLPRTSKVKRSSSSTVSLMRVNKYFWFSFKKFPKKKKLSGTLRCEKWLSVLARNQRHEAVPYKKVCAFSMNKGKTLGCKIPVNKNKKTKTKYTISIHAERQTG